MKQKKIELDVDFIGNQDGLTNKEEKSLNEFFKKQKLSLRRRGSRNKTKTSKHNKNET